MATNEEWRGIMQRARKDHGLSQKELGAKVGTSQNIISLIESGEVTSSQFVLPICDVLKIPPPVHFRDEEDRAWWQAGHVLRARNMRRFKLALALVEAMGDEEYLAEPVKDAEPDGKAAPERPAPNTQQRK